MPRHTTDQKTVYRIHVTTLNRQQDRVFHTYFGPYTNRQTAQKVLDHDITSWFGVVDNLQLEESTLDWHNV